MVDTCGMQRYGIAIQPMASLRQDEHATALGADTLPSGFARAPQAVWNNRPAPPQRWFVTAAKIVGIAVIGLTLYFFVTGDLIPDALDMIGRAAAPPFPIEHAQVNR
jgi:hypothetical protein